MTRKIAPRKTPVAANAKSARLDAVAPITPATSVDDALASPLGNIERPAAIKATQSTKATQTVDRVVQMAKGTRKAGSRGVGVTKTAPLTIAPLSRGTGSRVTAKSPPQDASDSDSRIFQIYFESWHLELLDGAFEPFDNRGVKSEFLEFDVFQRIFSSGEVQNAKLWGALSWRFTEKTGMSGKDLLAHVAANPGYDVYYCNPYPHNEALFQNMWLQGETCHPRFLEISKAVFEAAGLSKEYLISLQHSSSYSASNYFIATDAFWKAYIPFVQRIIGLAETKMSAPMRQLLNSSDADPRRMHSGASYVSFIVERLLPIFMKTSGRKLKGYKIPLPKREEDMNGHLRLLREMKDMAHQTNSKWLAVCWTNYRNLYFSQTNGAEWCAEHVRHITPTSVNFG
jgi:hypothetical protein